VPIEDLRLLSLDYIGFDGGVHTGEMVVHRDVAKDVVEVFGKLFEARFPIRRMRLVDDYGGDDDRSMAADNTSAFDRDIDQIAHRLVDRLNRALNNGRVSLPRFI